MATTSTTTSVWRSGGGDSTKTSYAGSMLMVLSFLGIFGTLVSDLLLLWLDPRIRFEGGTK